MIHPWMVLPQIQAFSLYCFIQTASLFKERPSGKIDAPRHCSKGSQTFTFDRPFLAVSFHCDDWALVLKSHVSSPVMSLLTLYHQKNCMPWVNRYANILSNSSNSDSKILYNHFLYCFTVFIGCWRTGTSRALLTDSRISAKNLYYLLRCCLHTSHF